MRKKWVAIISVVLMLGSIIETGVSQTVWASTNNSTNIDDAGQYIAANAGTNSAYVNTVTRLNGSTAARAGLKPIGNGFFAIDTSAAGYTETIDGTLYYVNPVINKTGITSSQADLELVNGQYMNTDKQIEFYSTTGDYLNPVTGVYADTKAGAEAGPKSLNSSMISISSGAITKGEQLFDNPKAPVSNYMFDSSGWLENFNPIFGVADTTFAFTVSLMYFALNFFKTGYTVNGLDGITGIVLNILHSAYQKVAVPLIPLSVLLLIGVFIWFGFFKKDLPNVFGRVVKVAGTFLLIVFISSPMVVNSQLIQKIGAFPGTIGNFAGGIVESVVASATGQKASSTNSLIDNAWNDIVLQEWISGEEGANYNVAGTAIVGLQSKDAAWRSILGYPLGSSQRNQVVQNLKNSPTGQAAFSFGARFVIAIEAFFGNIGAIVYFLVMGLVMLFARLAFLILVAAGAIILPLELFPFTRANTLTLRWIQYMAMSLFLIFFVSVYSSILFGIDQIVITMSQDTPGLGGLNSLSASSSAFFWQGVVYLIAVLVAWWIYRKMKPMQRIRTATEKTAKQGLPLGWGQRLSAEARRSRQWEKRGVSRSTVSKEHHDRKSSSLIRRTAEGVRDAKSLGRLDAALRHQSDSAEESGSIPPHDDFNHSVTGETVEPGEMQDRLFSEWEFEPVNGERRLGAEAYHQLNSGGHGVPMPHHPVRIQPSNGGESAFEKWSGVGEKEVTAGDEVLGESMESNEHHGEEWGTPGTSTEQTELVANVSEEPQWLLVAKEKHGESDHDTPIHHYAPTGKSPHEKTTDNRQTSIPPLKRTETQASGVNNQRDKQATTKKPQVNTIGKWETRMSKITKAIAASKVLASPDQAMDKGVEATLGLGSKKVTDMGKSAAFHLIRKIAAKRAEMDDQLQKPKKAKRQTDPAAVKARKTMGMMPPDLSYVDAFHQALNEVGDAAQWQTNPTSQADPTVLPPIDTLLTSDRTKLLPESRGKDTETDTMVNPAPSTSIERPILRRLDVVDTVSTPLSLKRHGIKAKHFSKGKRSTYKRVRHISRTMKTPVSKPDRPTLRRKGPSLSDRIFGGGHR